MKLYAPFGLMKGAVHSSIQEYFRLTNKSDLRSFEAVRVNALFPLLVVLKGVIQ